MKKSKGLLLAGLLASFISNSAMAEEGKVYAAIDLGQVSAPDVCSGTGFTCDTTTTAYRVGLGYRINPNVDVEGSYLNAGKVTVNGTAANATMSGFQFSAIGAYPLTSSAALLGKIGIASIIGKASGFGSSSTDQSNSNLALGFGARFTANDKVTIRIMYEDFGTIKASSNSKGSKVTMLSAGVQVGF
jgi:opacity protein-like surface antigen